jgi:hypothetical protein
MAPLMTTAGERRPCTAYLMGCPVIAELGTDLDHQLAELLTALGVKATEVLYPTRVAGRRASVRRPAFSRTGWPGGGTGTAR